MRSATARQREAGQRQKENQEVATASICAASPKGVGVERKLPVPFGSFAELLDRAAGPS